MVEPVGAPKKVGIVGGGPAGLQAAMTAADRGHQVVLFEKSNALGGQLKHADYASFKWPLANFKDYLIRQCRKAEHRNSLEHRCHPGVAERACTG